MASRPKKTSMNSAASADDIRKLTDAVLGLDNKVTQLTLRLTGDSAMQTRGLIHDVADTREDVKNLWLELQAVKDSFQEQANKVAGLEAQNADQADLLKDLRFVSALTDRVWKIVALLLGGGIATPILANWFRGLAGGK